MQYRTISNQKDFHLKTFFFQWEWILFLLFILVNLINAGMSPFYLDINNLLDATMGFLDKAFIVLPMVFIIILGDIDISVGSTVALTSVILASLYRFGMPMELAILISIFAGMIFGMINGLLIVKFKELSAVIVTLTTMIIYRGIAYTILEDKAVGNFPEWFSFFGWGYIGGIPFIFIMFILLSVIFGLLLHQTTFGRYIYAIGSNSTAARFTGIQIDRIKVIVYTLAGLMAAVTSIFLTSRMGSTRPNIANMYELEVITMTVLGGISTSGGKGRMIGAVIAVFLVGLLRYGLGLINVPAQTQLIIIGLILIIAVMAPNVRIAAVKGKSRP